MNNAPLIPIFGCSDNETLAHLKDKIKDLQRQNIILSIIEILLFISVIGVFLLFIIFLLGGR